MDLTSQDDTLQESPDVQFSEDSSAAESVRSTKRPTSTTRATPATKRKKRVEQEETLLQKAINCMDIFGQYIAAELRSIENIHVKRYTKWQIQSLMFNAHSGFPTQPGPSSHSGFPTQPGPSWQQPGRSVFPTHQMPIMLDRSANDFPQPMAMAQRSSTPSPFPPSSPFPEHNID